MIGTDRCMFLIVFAGLAISTLISQSGCKPASDGTLELLDTQLATLKIDDLSRTMDFVFSEKRFDQDEFVDKVASGLNRWSRAESALFEIDEWTIDPLVSKVRDAYAEEPLTQSVEETSFANTDPFFMQQCVWLNKIANRISKPGNLGAFEFYRLAAGQLMPSDDSEDALADIVSKLHPDLSSEESHDLTKALRGFDWIVRNIQLEEAPAVEDELVGGLGYKRMPWQVLVYGRGDYVERAKLFMLLVQQMGLDSVMLSVGEGDDQRLWSPAVLIGGELYLFDTRLGLPVPADKPGTIATLSDVRSNPEILRALDLSVEETLDDDNEYWVTEQDLKHVIALVYTSPEMASRRMAVVEKNVVGEHRVTLSSSPQAIAEQLSNIDGLTVEAWDIGFQTHQFRRELRDAVAKSSFDNVIADKIRWHFKEEMYIDEFSVYRTARSRYFGGRFEVQDRRRNAIESFYILMYDDETIGQLATDTMLQRQIGILKTKGQSAAEFQQRVKSVQEQMKLVRRDAGFFLAQCHFDNGNIGTAANWLDRLLKKADAQRWRTGVEYLLGRSLESRREYDRAVEVYEASDSPQKHGNLIRSRQLKELVETL